MNPNRLLRLLNDNSAHRARRAGAAGTSARGLRVTRAANAADEATVYLYDMIVGSDMEAEFWGGVSPEAFAKQLADIKASTIHLRINSPGGDVFAARAIEAALREHPATVIAHIDGLAASAASFIALAANEVRIAPGAMMMIHKAWTIAYGNADEFVSVAALLEKIDGTLADTYAKKTGESRVDMLALMADETWFTGAEAVSIGLADALDESDAEPDQAKALAWNLGAFEKAPAQSASAADVERIVKAELAKALSGESQLVPGAIALTTAASSGDAARALAQSIAAAKTAAPATPAPAMSHAEARARARLLSKEFA